jgi:hypothetical protein
MIAVTSFAHLNLQQDLVICVTATLAFVLTLIDRHLMQVGPLACATVAGPCSTSTLYSPALCCRDIWGSSFVLCRSLANWTGTSQEGRQSGSQRPALE